MTRPILYSFRRCPYAMRARLALYTSGTVCELREIVLRDKASAFLNASPKGTVPVLVCADGQVLEESLDVMLWALGQADPDGWLAPQDAPLERALELIGRADTDFKSNLDTYKYASRFTPDAADAARQNGAGFLADLDDILRTKPYLFGQVPSLADMAIAPFVRQFANVDRNWFDAQDWPGLQHWLNTFLRSEIFESIMLKYPKWQSGDSVTWFAKA
jgi:glutathione S-transferase